MRDSLQKLRDLPVVTSGGLPPYLVRVAWGDITLVYSIFAAVLFGVTVLTTMFLSRQQVSTLVKLGDA